MVLVYSQQRAGEPVRAVLGTLVLLGLSVALAYAVIAHKDRLYSAPLGSEKAYPLGQIRARLPVDWESLNVDELPEGVLAAVRSPPGQHPEQTLYLFRGFSSDLSPSKRATSVLNSFVRQALPGFQPFADSVSPSRGGTYTAWIVSLWLLSGDLENLARPEGSLVGRVACLPNGETVGLAIHSKDAPRRRDQLLLERLARHVEYLGNRPADDPESVMRQVGIRFALPARSRVMPPPDEAIPQLRLMVGDAWDYWQATITRIPLVEGRTPERIVADVLLEQTLKVEPAREIGSTERDARRIVHVGIPGVVDQAGVDSRHCYCVQIDASTAMLLVAVGEGRVVDHMRRECLRIAAEAEVDAISTWFDPAGARERAMQWIRRVERDGLEAILSDLQSNGRKFTAYDPGRVFRGFLSYDYRLSEQEDRWWKIVFRMDRTFGRDIWIKNRQTTLIREDGRAHDDVLSVRSDEIGLNYTEKWRAGGELSRRLYIEGEGDYEESFRPSDIFLSLTLLEHLYAEMARDEEAAPVIFTSTTALTRGEHAWVVHPLGRRPLPWQKRGAEPSDAWAIRVFQDYDPEYIDAYYDGDGRWLGLMFSDGRWYEEGRPDMKGGDLRQYLRKLFLNSD